MRGRPQMLSTQLPVHVGLVQLLGGLKIRESLVDCYTYDHMASRSSPSQRADGPRVRLAMSSQISRGMTRSVRL